MSGVSLLGESTPLREVINLLAQQTGRLSQLNFLMIASEGTGVRSARMGGGAQHLAGLTLYAKLLPALLHSHFNLGTLQFFTFMHANYFSAHLIHAQNPQKQMNCVQIMKEPSLRYLNFEDTRQIITTHEQMKQVLQEFCLLIWDC